MLVSLFVSVFLSVSLSYAHKPPPFQAPQQDPWWSPDIVMAIEKARLARTHGFNEGIERRGTRRVDVNNLGAMWKE